jgi:hypothetical protein
LLPRRPRSTGLGPVFEPLFCLQVTAVGDRSLPFKLVGRVQLGEQQLVQLLPDARLLPRSKPTPSGHPAAEAKLLRQMLPANPRVQHKQDPLQRTTIVERLPTRIPIPGAASSAAAVRSAPTTRPTPPTASPSSTPSATLTTGADGIRYR